MHDRSRPQARAIDTVSLRARLAELMAEAREVGASAEQADEIASMDERLRAFDDMCRRTTSTVLSSGGARWGDQLRHPASAGDAAIVRTGDQVLFRGREISLMEATRLLAPVTGKGLSISDWTGPRGFRYGDAFRTEHPKRATAEAEPAQTSLF